MRAGGYRRSEGVEAFSVHIRDRKLPLDHPYRSRSALDWSIILEGFLVNLDWKNMEIGHVRNILNNDGEITKGFESFGLTNRGNACRIAYEMEATIIGDGLSGVISSQNSESAKMDLRDFEAIVRKTDEFCIFVSGDLPRDYP